MIGIVGNKSDLYAQEKVREDEARQFAEEHGLEFQQVSAKCNSYIHFFFQEVSEKYYGIVTGNKGDDDDDDDDDNHNKRKVRLDIDEIKTKKRCC